MSFAKRKLNGGSTMGDNVKELQTRWPSLRDPLAEETTVDTDPLAELPPETVAVADEAAPADEWRGTSSSPQARLVSVTEASNLVSESQLRCQLATDRQRECRGRVALALEKFQRATMQTCTPEQLVRQHIASSNQERADRVAGKAPVRPQRRLGSAVDSFAFHTRNSGRGAGGGAAFRRGAHSQSGRNVLGAAPKAFPGSGLPQIKE
jgi:hypothetical protein